jgi:ComF family protein
MKILQQGSEWMYALGSLFFPHLCAGCGNNNIGSDEAICHHCLAHFPVTNFASQPHNPVEKLFWGQLKVTAASSAFYFNRSSGIQHALHELKYKNNKKTGHILGSLLGYSLLEGNRFSNINAIVPLPLYPDKERQRGYNQATIIAEGIQEILNIPLITDAVSRNRHTPSQTRKNRIERWENVDGVFTLKKSTALQGKKILLTDDVVTTGASLEACGEILWQAGIDSLYISTLAFAEQ